MKCRETYGLIAHDPTVVSGCDIEQIPRLQLNDAAIVHGGGCPAGEHKSDVFDHAASLSDEVAHVD